MSQTVYIFKQYFSHFSLIFNYVLRFNWFHFSSLYEVSTETLEVYLPQPFSKHEIFLWPWVSDKIMTLLEKVHKKDPRAFAGEMLEHNL